MEKRNYFAEMNKGKRFFVNGKEITFEEAIEIDKKNAEIIRESNNVADWAGITFITII